MTSRENDLLSSLDRLWLIKQLRFDQQRSGRKPSSELYRRNCMMWLNLPAVVFHMFSCGCCCRVFYSSFSDANGTRNLLHCHRKAFTSPGILWTVLPNNGNGQQHWLHQHSSLTKIQRNAWSRSRKESSVHVVTAIPFAPNACYGWRVQTAMFWRNGKPTKFGLAKHGGRKLGWLAARVSEANQRRAIQYSSGTSVACGFTDRNMWVHRRGKRLQKYAVVYFPSRYCWRSFCVWT